MLCLHVKLVYFEVSIRPYLTGFPVADLLRVFDCGSWLGAPLWEGKSLFIQVNTNVRLCVWIQLRPRRLFLYVGQRTARGIRTSGDWVELFCPNCGENMESTAELQGGQRCVHVPKHPCEMCWGATEDHVLIWCLLQKGAFISVTQLMHLKKRFLKKIKNKLTLFLCLYPRQERGQRPI